ncbi:MAG: sigma-54-dependent transcriptional regulator [Acidobacteriota bacterium]
MARVIVVDDETAVLKFACDVLQHAGHIAVAAEEGNSALARVRAEPFDIGLVDVKLPGLNGIAVLAAMRALQPKLGAIAMTAYPQHPVSVDETARAGAFEYLQKPFKAAELLRSIDVVVNALRVRPSISANSVQLEAETFQGLVGASPGMRGLYTWLGRVAPTREPVLLEGETGTGKELVARAIHRLSGRTAFVPLNCAAAGPEGLLEKELFGSESGAFTDARERSTGWFEAANRGTLFLDEIGELSLSGQAKLLRVLEDRQFTRLGGRSTVTVDVRIIAATNKDLDATAGSTFRRDLFYRLNAFSITLPPLRERAGDVRLLLDYLLPVLAGELGVTTPSITESALERLEAYAWPGNVRELQQVLKQACLRDDDQRLDIEDVPDRVARGISDLSPALDMMKSGTLAEVVGHRTEIVERNIIARTLARHSNLADAARELGIDQKTLYRKRLQHKLLD